MHGGTMSPASWKKKEIKDTDDNRSTWQPYIEKITKEVNFFDFHSNFPLFWPANNTQK